jgi:hypothetical protein
MDAMVMLRAVPVDRKTYSFECDGNLFGRSLELLLGIGQLLALSQYLNFFYRQRASLVRG